MGPPVWDQSRIWVPTSSGLYAVERDTGHVTWLAYQDGNWFLSVLKADGQLYVATSRGLYYQGDPPPVGAPPAARTRRGGHTRPRRACSGGARFIGQHP